MLSQGSTLIVDDRLEDGQPISDRLSELCVPHLFFHADDQNLLRIKTTPPANLYKVRIVFQDINLTGSTTPSTKDYDYAVGVLEKLLSKDNGPWLMVAWSTWSGGDENKYAEELFNHLRKELEPGRSPYAYVALNKSDFTGGVAHGTVIQYGKMVKKVKESFAKRIEKAVSATPAMSALMRWEKAVGEAVSSILTNLHSLSNFEADHDKRLGRLLFELAKAEAGKSINKDNSLAALIRILNRQLLDRVTPLDAQGLDLGNYSTVPVPTDTKEWKRRINRSLNFEISGRNDGPGTLYSYKSYLKALAYCHSSTPLIAEDQPVTIECKDLVVGENVFRNTFLRPLETHNYKKAEYEKPIRECVEKAECVIIETTPPCDHAQNKSEWVKFCAGIIVDLTGLSNGIVDEFINIFRTPDYLWNSCAFSVESEGKNIDHKILFFNSRTTFSVPDNAEVKVNLERASISNMREQITRDLTHWLGRQLSRPGYTSM